MAVKRYLYALDLDKAVSCLWWVPLLFSNPKLSNRTYWPVHFPFTRRYWLVLCRRRHQTFSPAHLCPLRECDLLHFQCISWRRASSNITRRYCKALLRIAPYGWPFCRDPYWPCTGFKALADDPLLKKHRITVELGQAKNPNKNPVAARAVQELEMELLRQEPLGGAVSPLTLAVATSALNSRIRSRGLSSREMWTQRDQFSNQQLPLADDHLIALQHEQRLSNHPHSERSKAPLHNRRPTPVIDVGDLVYLHSDRNKSRARDRYLVVAIDPPFCDIKKFIRSQLRSSSYRVKLTECFKVPSDLADSLHAPRQCRGHDTDDEDDADTTPHPHPRCLTSLMLSLLQPSI